MGARLRAAGLSARRDHAVLGRPGGGGGRGREGARGPPVRASRAGWDRSPLRRQSNRASDGPQGRRHRRNREGFRGVQRRARPVGRTGLRRVRGQTRRCVPATSARAGSWPRSGGPSSTPATASEWPWRSAPSPTAIGAAVTRWPGTSTRRPTATGTSPTCSKSTPIHSA